MSSLPFRQIHLDFHTPSTIPNVGASFDRRKWQETLKRAEVNSVTCFSKCHHGWSYHPTRVGKMHPRLSFDLLRAQFDACKEIGINVPIYLSAGYDDLAAENHADWREVGPDGRTVAPNGGPLLPGFRKMDFLSPYLDYLCEQIEEAVALFPYCDGVFLDIIRQGECCSRWALEYMQASGLDPLVQADRRVAAEHALKRYYERTTAACRVLRPDMPVVHNSGHIPRGRHDLLGYQKHLELESLPTGGWGYDHFPESALYAANLGKPYLGMTGKFHTTWGEFGGFKHPNALRYECSSMLAFGAACSIGDQLHPGGELDATTYDIIGAAYREVAVKQPWCEGGKPVAQIAILSSEAEHPETVRNNGPDTGATRLLLEGHHLFCLIDRDSEFERFSVLVLPDDIRVDPPLEAKLRRYLSAGGRLFLTGESGLSTDGRRFAVDIGAEWYGPSEFTPDYILPSETLATEFSRTPSVSYLGSQRIRVSGGESLGAVFDPYFNRNYAHYCGHQHAPPQPEPSGFDCGVRMGNVIYLAHRVFSAYRAFGQVSLRHYVDLCLRELLGQDRILETNLPSMARATLMRLRSGKWIVHLLYANLINRGGGLALDGGQGQVTGRSLEVIEDLLPLLDVKISVLLPQSVCRVTLEPQGEELSFVQNDQRVEVQIPRFVCHQMVAFHVDAAK